METMRASEDAAMIETFTAALPSAALSSVETITMYRLAEPVLFTSWGHDYVATLLRVRVAVEDGEAFTDVEAHAADATKAGVARKGAIRTWRTLPAALAAPILAAAEAAR